jgi:HTH-type transcriptional regulator, transcriptional repressor of NAD biosynthesis genes
VKHGMVLGKFLPPHAGHVYLVEVARRMCDELTVVVGSLAREPIPGELRVRWMRELFPDVRVVHLGDENPQQPEEHPDFWSIWKNSLIRVLPAAPDVVFSSESYGQKLAEVLGARSVVVDPERIALPVSGSAVREDPFGNWRYLPAPVRAHFAKRVVVFGPESTGKTTLARRLAEHFQTRWVPEFARAHLEAQDGKIAPSDIEVIACGQQAAEDALARDANRLLFCDTDVLATELWSNALFGSCPDWIREAARSRRYPLTLLCDVDVPFVPDAVRYLPNARRAFFERAEAALRKVDRRFVRIFGDWETRFSTAVAAVESLLETRSTR